MEGILENLNSVTRRRWTSNSLRLLQPQNKDESMTRKVKLGHLPGLLSAWISTSKGRHNRKTRLSSSFPLSPQLSCEDSPAGGSFVSVSLKMSSTACQHHKCAQLMQSVVLMGFLRAGTSVTLWTVALFFPFRWFLRSVMYPPRKLRLSLGGKSWVGESSL